MGVQLERKRTRADHVQVPGAVRRPQEVAHRQRGAFPVQEHVPVGKQLCGEQMNQTSSYFVCLSNKHLNLIRSTSVH